MLKQYQAYAYSFYFYFTHYSTIQMDGYRTLKAGQSVRFDVHQGPKGNHASLIVPIEAETVA